MMARLSSHYSFTPDYILKKMTWGQVWLYYEAALAHLQEKDYEGEEDQEPQRLEPGMAGVVRRDDGALMYGK